MKTPSRFLKPRNPFVAASLRRVAGSHARSTRALRQGQQRALRDELQQLKHSP